MVITDLLQQIPLFESLNRSERQRLAKLLQSRSLSKGEVLFHKGDPGSAFFIIIKGSIKIGVMNNFGEEVIFSFLGSGDCFGEMALLDKQPRSADATAVEDSLLYVLDSNDFFRFLIQSENTVRSVIGALLRILSQRLRRADNLLEEISFLSVPARLARRLLELAESVPAAERESQKCLIRISQRELAGMLGVTRESISKELKILRQKGLVTTGRNSIILHDLEDLKGRTC